MAGEGDTTASETGLRRMRILICENEYLIALTLRTQLQEIGHEVVGVVRSGEECLALARATQPDLVLMDFGLEGLMDGAEATRLLLQERPLPVVMLTAYTDDQTVRAATEAGACGYLLKPANEDQLRTALHVAAARFAEMEQMRQEQSPGSKQARLEAGVATPQSAGIETPQQITVSAEYHPERSAIGLSIVTKRGPVKHLMERKLTDDMLGDLREFLDRVGMCAVQRAKVRGADPDAVRASEVDIRDTLVRIGNFSANRVLHPMARTCLAEQQACHLWISYSPIPVLAAIPWELLRSGGEFLCRRFWLARSPRIVGTSETRPPRSDQDGLDILVIPDPTGDLSFARGECEQIAAHFEEHSASGRARLKFLSTSNRAEILAEMDGRDIVHFAGHVYYDQADPPRSGWVLELDQERKQPRRVLPACEFLDLERPPLMVFSNACASARDDVAAGQPCPSVYDRNAAGLAQAFMEGGIEIYVGTMWAIPDEEPTVAFAKAFYSSLLSGRTSGQAMWDARRQVIETLGEGELTWASYLLFGNPTTRLVEPGPLEAPARSIPTGAQEPSPKAAPVAPSEREAETTPELEAGPGSVEEGQVPGEQQPTPPMADENLPVPESEPMPPGGEQPEGAAAEVVVQPRTRKSVVCPHCGCGENREGYSYCGLCGRKLPRRLFSRR